MRLNINYFTIKILIHAAVSLIARNYLCMEGTQKTFSAKASSCIRGCYNRCAVPSETRHNLTRPLARGGRYITRAPFHSKDLAPFSLIPLHPIRPSRPSFSLTSLYFLLASSLASRSTLLSHSRNIVRSDCAAQCVAFNSTPEPWYRILPGLYG